jgi:L-aspartate oxidase
MIPMDVLETDILILGAGLAGLRAAISASISAPAKRITIVSLSTEPSGSSFANRNNCLGMQVCVEDADRAEFLAETEKLTTPGVFDDSLARIMAQESLPRFEDLVRLDLRFRTDKNGDWERYPACFSPSSRRALIFEDLPHAFRCFQRALDGPSISRVSAEVLRLIQPSRGDRVFGALLRDASRGDIFAIRADAVIMCLGGPASLFRHNVCGSGVSGHSYALLDFTGAKLENLSFLQLMWYRLDRLVFFPLQQLARPGAFIGKARTALPEDFAELAPSRATHCPFAFGFADNSLDRFVADYLQSDGSVEVTSGDEIFRIAPMAHAGNGGAIIDIHGRTSVPSLYACGECATGMHGANRIGGGMILATQVFGHRAGAHAAHARLNEQAKMTDKTFTQLANEAFQEMILTANQSEYRFAPKSADWIMTRSNYLDIRTDMGHLKNRAKLHTPLKSNLCRASLALIVQHHQSLS